MLWKCANPFCFTRFRYLHEGRLIGVQFKPVPDCHAASVLDHSDGRTIEYFWLCPACAPMMTLRVEKTTVVISRHSPVPAADNSISDKAAHAAA